MGVNPKIFFSQMEPFFNYRTVVYEASPQTIKTNRTDLNLFEAFIRDRNIKTIDGPAMIDFQFHLKNDRNNSGASINRKIFSLRSYGNFVKLYDMPHAQTLPFYDVLKIRQGYRKRPNALTPAQIGQLLKGIDGDTILGIRDYAVNALMYQLGLRVGEVHGLNLEDIDFDENKISVMGKGNK
ncbi:MAG: tyrosine-type recombinase/integrase, partial [Desulfobacteraceae bacterium]|nr:tyrosine-type recombinase/integrase [Desulfobacteraceae bacterium]